MIIVKFYFNDIEEEFEFEDHDDPESEEFIWDMEYERENWMAGLRKDDTGYEIIKVVKNEEDDNITKK